MALTATLNAPGKKPLTMKDHPDLILFDYGGVLLRLNDPVETFGFGDDRADFSRRWLDSPAVQAHETGRIGPDEFGRRMVRDMRLPYPPDEFIRRFDAWPDRVTPATAALVRSIPAQVDCAILSNTNELHWRRQDIERDFAGRISRTWLSFETGYVKPDPRAFRIVLDELGLPAGRVLFIDDNPKNLEAADALGLCTRHCRDVDALADVLVGEGLVA